MLVGNLGAERLSGRERDRSGRLDALGSGLGDGRERGRGLGRRGGRGGLHTSCGRAVRRPRGAIGIGGELVGPACIDRGRVDLVLLAKLLDHARVPKHAWDTVRRACAPVVVVASEATQVARAMQRDGATEAQVRARIAAQIPLAEKAALAAAAEPRG